VGGALPFANAFEPHVDGGSRRKALELLTRGLVMSAGSTGVAPLAGGHTYGIS
jgi:hypothetical protein